MAAYKEAQAERVEVALQSDPVSAAVLSLMEKQNSWVGTPTELLFKLKQFAPDGIETSYSWPKVPKVLSDRLTRAAPFLRAVGIEIEPLRKDHKRFVVIRKSCVSSVPCVPENGEPGSDTSDARLENFGFSGGGKPIGDRDAGDAGDAEIRN